jgi:OOP family OmpA-OmpF porin
VRDQAYFHLAGAFTFLGAVTLSVDLPFAAQGGTSVSAGGYSFQAPPAIALGDLRLGGRARVFGGDGDAFQLAVSALVWVPTGSPRAYTSDGTVRSLPEVVAGGRTDRIVWSASAGPELRFAKSFVNVRPGPAFRWGVGVGVLLGDTRSLQIGPEITGSVAPGDVQRRNVQVEGLLGARQWLRGGFELGLGAGTSFAPGVGAPAFRAIAMFSYAPDLWPSKKDRDGDGILDPEDACPDVGGVADSDPARNGCPLKPAADRDGDQIADPEDACPDKPGSADIIPARHGCPEVKLADRDGDQIADDEDACPDAPGPSNPDRKRHGCAPKPDRDGDGVPDDEDACPDKPGDPSKDPKRNGCPGDRDGDGIVDDKDACPEDKGPADPDPTKNGCPRDVRVTEGAIIILQQVQFDTGKATIRLESKALLDTVADVLKQHPEIAKIEVGGHTDNKGSTDQNMALSQRRAEAVREALVKRGIDGARLSAKGYGPTRPIMANITSVGRKANRRVEFKILERQPK